MTATLPHVVLPRHTARRTARGSTGRDVELIVDNFAGAGGASLGIEAALGRAVDLAINHDRMMVELHALNHPNTRHLAEDVWDVDPALQCGGRPVGLAWFSPDCKHFSKAKGGRPVEKKIRGLAWVALRWVIAVRPRVVILENVEEFQTWGPINAAGLPDKTRRGDFFRAFKGALGEGMEPPCEALRSELEEFFKDNASAAIARMIGGLGYRVEHRELVAADYGVPTTRKRFFLIARCDDQPIAWPEPTHAPRKKALALGKKPWRAAAECIDWTLPCPSIFERKRPLAEATLRRIARGLVKYVIQAAEPFIVCCNHGGPELRARSVADPAATVTGSRDANGLVGATMVQTGYGEREGQLPRVPPIDGPMGSVVSTGKHAVAMAPMIAGAGGSTYAGKPRSVEDPLNTVKSDNRQAVVAACLQRFRFGEKEHTDPRDPAQTVCAGGNHTAEVAAFLTRCAHGDVGRRGLGIEDMEAPVPTQTASKDYALTAVHLVKNYTGVNGHGVDRPIGTVTAVDHHALCGALLVGVGGRAGQSPEKSPADPVHTITAKGDTALAAAHLTKLYGTCQTGVDAREPMPTATGGGNHIAEVRAFLVKYYGTGGQDQAASDPLHTLTAKARMGLVTVQGEEYQITDIGLRMLEPVELLRAQFGRFAAEYVLYGTKARQVAAIGNSVPPEVAEAIVRANFPRGRNKK